MAFASTFGLHGLQRKPSEVGFSGCNGAALSLSRGEHRVWVDFELELGHERRPSGGGGVSWVMTAVLRIGAKAAAEGGYGGVHKENALPPPASFPTVASGTPKGGERAV